MKRVVESFEDFVGKKIINENHIDDNTDYEMDEYEDGIDIRVKKIADRIVDDTLAFPPRGGRKKYRGLDLEFSKLIWARNMVDGWDIHIYESGSHLGTIHVDGNLGKIYIDDEFYKSF
jgi:hypothetical protein